MRLKACGGRLGFAKARQLPGEAGVVCSFFNSVGAYNALSQPAGLPVRSLVYPSEMATTPT